MTEIEWKKEWFGNMKVFPYSFWTDKKNQRNFLEDVSKKLGIKQPSDWISVGENRIREYGGRGLLFRNEHSLRKAVLTNFPEVNWRSLGWKERITKAHWNSEENQRKFLENIATQWKRITLGLLRSKGGSGLLDKYNNSLVDALQNLFPGETWGELGTLTSVTESSKPQIYAKEWFPLATISHNYRHPKLKTPRKKEAIELDVFIHEFNLAFEYHGVQHYRDSYNKDLTQQQSRDILRRSECSKAGITLIEIPYWWDESEQRLLATVLQARPDLLSVIKSKLLKENSMISDWVSETKAIPQQKQKYDSDFLMLSTYWNLDQDPKGWLVSEKLDGVRGYWDGRNLYYRSGKLMHAPKWFIEKLPEFPLDGEIWAGRLSFFTTNQRIMGDWNSLQFKIFDAPKLPGNYLDRFQVIKSIMQDRSFGEHVSLIQQTECESKEQLFKLLEETLRNGGEGLVLRNPRARYEVGRSLNSLKVKPLYTEKVVVMELEEMKKIQGDSSPAYKFYHVEVKK